MKDEPTLDLKTQVLDMMQDLMDRLHEESFSASKWRQNYYEARKEILSLRLDILNAHFDIKDLVKEIGEDRAMLRSNPSAPMPEGSTGQGRVTAAPSEAAPQTFQRAQSEKPLAATPQPHRQCVIPRDFQLQAPSGRIGHMSIIQKSTLPLIQRVCIEIDGLSMPNVMEYIDYVRWWREIFQEQYLPEKLLENEIQQTARHFERELASRESEKGGSKQ